MLHTYLTTSWHLRYPIIGAPMAGIGRGRLARAVSEAGGLGMIGIGSTESVELIAREAAIARGTDQGRFGIGLLAWAIESRPELLDTAIEASPFPVSLPPTPQDWKHHLVQDNFGPAARAYTTSKAHASGPDLAWIEDGLISFALPAAVIVWVKPV
jgi:NAD(P)H-dependent flavin oxidoreductase YrpB (nitropropane dioxygenase family)